MDRARAAVLEERKLRAGQADTGQADTAQAEDDFDDDADSSEDSWLVRELAPMVREAWRALGLPSQ